jgi:hypothetical protein
MTRKQFNAREFERELVDAGYMPTSEYVRRWGEDKDEALSSRAAFPVDQRSTLYDDLYELWRRFSTDITEPKDHARERADD